MFHIKNVRFKVGQDAVMEGFCQSELCLLPAGRRGVQHREGSPGADAEAEDHGVLREEREADRAAEKNVSHDSKSHASNTPSFTSATHF